MMLLMKSKGWVSQRAPTAAVAPHGARALTLTLPASRATRGYKRGRRVW